MLPELTYQLDSCGSWTYNETWLQHWGQRPVRSYESCSVALAAKKKIDFPDMKTPEILPCCAN